MDRREPGRRRVDRELDARTLTRLSTRLLRAVRIGTDSEPEADLWHRLATIDERVLSTLGVEPDAGKTFWINIYNAATQRALEDDPTQFDDRRRFFTQPLVTVAGSQLSLDTIEHGLLRGAQWKYGFGYVPSPVPSSFERRQRLEHLDHRLHFALNCGAASCPPIVAYEVKAIDGQLEMATASYLESEVTYDSTAHTVTVPRLLLWYRGDFGGKRGICRLLDRHELIPPATRPRLRYGSYEWALRRGHYADS